jgi:hypothetical protein
MKARRHFEYTVRLGPLGSAVEGANPVAQAPHPLVPLPTETEGGQLMNTPLLSVFFHCLLYARCKVRCSDLPHGFVKRS